ncbi:unnamed protein product [Lepeophtheirus salmonis]|uniref:(salmon louse) hypothetical protein n=1 Tax=Lepeophtheirus salmonis TaxID=72036 RepID=A0A7R8CFV2_LEPSM|nr:unnamed protein product [Lepeophtheirus salmonis]CAF2763397.1 unnamed protein product [Lepeophtheirus salmonis]
MNTRKLPLKYMRSLGNPQRLLNGTEFVTLNKQYHSSKPTDEQTTASYTKPDYPSPQSQSLSRSYGSNLPTSLTYIILSTRGCSPRRPAADLWSKFLFKIFFLEKSKL